MATAMVMASADVTGRGHCLAVALLVMGVAAGSWSSGAEAARWQIDPRIAASLVGTDNVELASKGDEKSDLLGHLGPGVFVRGDGARLDFKLDYQMQMVFSLANGDRNQLTHQLYSDLGTEIVDDWIYFDAMGQIGQAIISSRESIPLDNLTFTSNLTDYARYKLTPRIRHSFGEAIELDTYYEYGEVRYKTGASDATIEGAGLRLSSGKEFTALSWSARHYFQDIARFSRTDPGNRSDAHYQSSSLEAAYRFSRKWSVVGQFGFENNELPNYITPVGSYWSAGLRWHPNRKFSLELQSGDRQDFGVLKITPLSRIGLNVTYRNRSVGLNPGPVWFWNLSYRGRRWTWDGAYSEDTRLRQQRDPYRKPIMFVDLETGGLFDPVTGEPVYCSGFDLSDCFTLSDDAYERKFGYLSGIWETAKTKIRVRFSGEKRHYLTNVREEEVNGLGASWRWRFGGRTSSRVSTSLIRTWYSFDQRVDWRRVGQLQFIRKLAPQAEGILAYRYSDRESTDVRAEYQENRITLQFKMVF